MSKYPEDARFSAEAHETLQTELEKTRIVADIYKENTC